ncbi:hypothetical protein CYMTET_17459 [Cymbomonas tetramitiformis]|uniref:GRIP domain-containing protein n=1 Tax=Cymbomonas tetramitiformis TaxID=36881 RepID=A0AAE0L7A9_9CHLO|nr:hypothetical protein CYMTET_17459 [Cymbomonas tetramitiformis]
MPQLRLSQQSGDGAGDQHQMQRQLEVELTYARQELGEREHALAEARRMAAKQEQTAMEREKTGGARMAELVAAHDTLKAQLEGKEAQHAAQLADVQRDQKSAEAAKVAAEGQLEARDRRIAELESETGGVETRLSATVESLKVDAMRKEREHAAEREKVKAALTELKKKAEKAERAKKKSDIALAAAQEKWALEREHVQAAHNWEDTSSGTVAEERDKLAEELQAYKLRAHSLLKKKDEQLASMRATIGTDAMEAEVRAAEVAAQEASQDRDDAERHAEELQRTLAEAERVQERQLESIQHAHSEVVTTMQAQAAATRQKLVEVQAETRTLKDAVSGHQQGLEASLQQQHTHLQAEFDSFRDIATSMMEAKDTALAKMLEKNAEQREAATPVSEPSTPFTPEGPAAEGESGLSGLGLGGGLGVLALDSASFIESAALQAKRDTILAQAEARIEALEVENIELEKENALRSEQEKVLKDEIREMTRREQRQEVAKGTSDIAGGCEMEYLKNVVLKLMETGEHEALLPVLSMLLRFSPDEVERCREAWQRLTAEPMPGAAAVVDSVIEQGSGLGILRGLW